MLKDKFEIKVLKTTAIIFIIGLIVFLCLIPIKYSLSLGWLCGAVFASATYLLGILLINKFFKKEKNKTLGFWVGMLRYYINLAIQAGLFIVIIVINKTANGHSFNGGGLSDMISPINLFTYIGGISLILISTLVAQFLSRKEG